MKRREFIAGVAGAAVAATVRPHSLKAQQSGRIYRIGFFGGALPASATANNVMEVGYPAFRDELRKRGFIDGRNLIIDFRSTRQDAGRLHAEASSWFAPT